MRRTAMAIVAVAAASIAWLAMPGQSAFANNGGCAQVNTGGLGLNNGKCVPAKNARLVEKKYRDKRGRLRIDRKAIAPASAPQAVKNVIARANQIRKLRYNWGGGRKPWPNIDRSGYDCSGAVSYALRGLGKDSEGKRYLPSPLDSTGLASWGKRGKGKWVTVYANGGHAYMVVAGLRFDTSRNGDTSSGPRWSKSMRSTRGTFKVRSPKGF